MVGALHHTVAVLLARDALNSQLLCSSVLSSASARTRAHTHTHANRCFFIQRCACNHFALHFQNDEQLTQVTHRVCNDTHTHTHAYSQECAGSWQVLLLSLLPATACCSETLGGGCLSHRTQATALPMDACMCVHQPVPLIHTVLSCLWAPSTGRHAGAVCRGRLCSRQHSSHSGGGCTALGGLGAAA